ncbi:MAG: hypothetical protein PHH06_01180 [Candidatus Gracilibacteria bacterium]|nr:hypothetical protein [Candidatus Gracilibacteria bacterium]
MVNSFKELLGGSEFKENGHDSFDRMDGPSDKDLKAIESEGGVELLSNQEIRRVLEQAMLEAYDGTLNDVNNILYGKLGNKIN